MSQSHVEVNGYCETHSLPIKACRKLSEPELLELEAEDVREWALARAEPHCKDCCCAKSWEALGLTEYTGRSIPEEIARLREWKARAVELLKPLHDAPEVAHRHYGACFACAGHNGHAPDCALSALLGEE